MDAYDSRLGYAPCAGSRESVVPVERFTRGTRPIARVECRECGRRFDTTTHRVSMPPVPNHKRPADQAGELRFVTIEAGRYRLEHRRLGTLGEVYRTYPRHPDGRRMATPTFGYRPADGSAGDEGFTRERAAELLALRVS